MNEAIKLAKEYGWNIAPKADWHNSLGHNNMLCMSEITHDPLFWQALGKALGRECKLHTVCEAPLGWKRTAQHYF